MRGNGTLAERIRSLYVACKREEVSVHYATIMRWALCRAAPRFLSPKDH
jgi:hypothetical protein